MWRCWRLLITAVKICRGGQCSGLRSQGAPTESDWPPHYQRRDLAWTVSGCVSVLNLRGSNESCLKCVVNWVERKVNAILMCVCVRDQTPPPLHLDHHVKKTLATPLEVCETWQHLHRSLGASVSGIKAAVCKWQGWVVVTNDPEHNITCFASKRPEYTILLEKKFTQEEWS